MACSSSCVSGPHRTYGECLRAKRLQVADVTAHKFNQNLHSELDAYRSAREAGLQPAGTRMAQVKKAWEITDKTGQPYRADVA